MVNVYRPGQYKGTKTIVGQKNVDDLKLEDVKNSGFSLFAQEFLSLNNLTSVRIYATLLLKITIS